VTGVQTCALPISTNFAQLVQTDWQYMVDNLKVTSQPNYLHHNGLPVVSIWGPGLNDGAHVPTDPAVLQTFIAWFHTGPTAYHAVYMGGTPSGWGTLNGDSYGGTGWAAAYNDMDVIQPWTVGRYSDTNGAKSWGKTKITPDLALAKTNGSLYLPVIFPGFSWFNLNQGKQNQIPRLGGKFLWSQAYGAKAAGATMLKFAMFDEVDEGTAMFKLAAKRTDAPDQGYWLTMDADGYTLPTDWYLRLAGEITGMFHGIRPLSATMPFDPAHPDAIAGSSRNLVQARQVSFTPGGGADFVLPGASGALRVYNVRGSGLRILPLLNGRAHWDGRDAEGRSLPAGLYLANALEAAGSQAAFKIILP
jgi:hypothetical protein